MNRIEIALPAKGAPGKGQPIPDDAATAQGKSTAFKNLLRQMAVKEGPARPEAEVKSEAGTARNASGADAVAAKKAEIRSSEKKPAHGGARAVADAISDAARANEAGRASGAEAPIAWPEALTQPPADPRLPRSTPDMSEEPQDGKSSAAQDLGRAVSLALPSGKPEAAAKPEQAGPRMPEGDNAADPFAVLNSMLKQDEVDLDRAVEPEVKAAPKMTVVVRETHFEPVQRLSPVQQIASAVADEAMAIDEAQFSRQPDPRAESSLRPGSAGPLRVLHIKLEPDDLGTVVLKMRLVDQSLELHLEASRAETAQLLEKDRDMLTRVLRASGYTPDVVTIQAAAASEAGQSQTGQAGTQGGGSSNGSANQGSPSQNGQSAEHRDQHARQSAPHKDQSDEEAGANRSRGDVYL